jgi:hypothetical protein
MSDFWKGILIGAAIGFVLGIAASVVAAYLWDLWARWKAHQTARKLIGTWGAYNIHGRTIDATDSGVLDVRAQDIDPSTGKTRDHSGSIVLDPIKPWLATRVYRYADSNERAQQQLEIEPDGNTVYVFPDPTVSTLGDVYGKHVLRRAL